MGQMLTAMPFFKADTRVRALWFEAQRQFGLPVNFICPAILFPFALVAYGNMFLGVPLIFRTVDVWI